MILYLKKIEVNELAKKWGLYAQTIMNKELIIDSGRNYVLIKCRKDGSINYEKAGVYSVNELKNRLIKIL